MVPLNEHDIVILGGYRSPWHDNSDQVVTLNTRTLKFEKLKDVQGASSMCFSDNYSCKIINNMVIALGWNRLIKFDKTTKTIKNIKIEETQER